MRFFVFGQQFDYGRSRSRAFRIRKAVKCRIILRPDRKTAVIGAAQKESIVMTEGSYASVFSLPNMADEFMVFPASVALQILAYYVSMDKGLDVDKPRNLAKVVTVE